MAAAVAGALAVNTNTNNSEDGRREQSEEVQESKRTSQKASGKADGTDNAWLNAHYDPVASIYTFSTCIVLDDLYGDGDNKLLVGDLGSGGYDAKLKVYKGTQVTLETPLIDLPTGVCTFYMDDTIPKMPAVAVASGSFVYVYKNLRPYFKFVLPTLDVNEAEASLWAQAKDDQIDVTVLRQLLDSMREEVGESAMTVRSLKFLQQSPEELQSFASLFCNTPLKRQTVITCMTTLHKTHADSNSISCLVIGTEHKDVYILDPEAFTILTKMSVPGVPVFLSAIGLYEVDYRIMAACRDACIYTLTKGSPEPKSQTQLSSQPCGLQRIGKTTIVATMDNKLTCYAGKSKCLWSVDLPEAVTALEVMDHTARGFKAVLVALKNSEVRVYKDKYLVNTLQMDDTVVGLKFGRFSREEGALVMVTQGGALIVKLLKRTVTFEGREVTSGPPAAQSTKLNVPKKTKVFVEQTQREREGGAVMHTAFQHDLYRLRLETSRAYVSSISRSLLPVSSSLTDSLKISAQVQGLGPLFKLTVSLQNTSPSSCASGLVLLFQWENGLYNVQKPVMELPLLVPSLSYDFENTVECLDTNGRTEPIKVMVHRHGNPIPLITAVIDMPASESLVIA